MAPKVSVIIPCYNYGKWLNEAVKSALNSDWDNLEVIIVDDGSDDKETIRVLDNIKHPKIKILRQNNQGVANARNNGIKIAEGKYILPLDSDDIIDSSFIKESVEILENDDCIGIVYSDFAYFGNIKNVVETPLWDSTKILYQNLFTNSSMFRKKDWERVGGYNPKMKNGYEDWEFWISLAQAGLKGYRIPAIRVFYRKHKLSRSDVASKNHLDNFKTIIKLHSEYYADNLEKIIFPILIKIMKYIPTEIKYRCTKRLIKNIFFSSSSTKHLREGFNCFIKDLLKFAK